MLRTQDKRLFLGTQLSEIFHGASPAFVGPALLDDFNRADENPLSGGGNWAEVSASSGNLRIISNEVACSVSTTSDAYWTPAVFGADCEAYCTIVTKPSTNGDGVEIIARAGDVGASTWDGYTFYMATQAGTDTWELRRFIAGSVTALTSGTREITNGEKIGIRCIGSRIEGWVYSAGAWTRITYTTDTTFHCPGYVAMRGRGTAFRLDDFYARTIN